MWFCLLNLGLKSWSSQYTTSQLLLSYVYNLEDQSCFHIFPRSSNIWSFIYSLAFFTFYGHIRNSPCDQIPVGLIAQLEEHCTGIGDVTSSSPIQGWSSFYLFVCITAMISHDFISFSGVHIYDLLYIHLHYLSVWLENERFIYTTDMSLHKNTLQGSLC